MYISRNKLEQFFSQLQEKKTKPKEDLLGDNRQANASKSSFRFG